jgi:hypothetical protein
MVTLQGKPTKEKDAITTYEIFMHQTKHQWWIRLLTSNKGRTIGFEEELYHTLFPYLEVIGNIHESVQQ